MRNLAINAERLWGEIMETASIGGTPKGGICRLTLTDLDRQVRDWFKTRAEQLGCRVTIDDMGVMFARREGTAKVPPIAFGSHLDTQPTGGKFDGVLGVLGALEALRTLVEAGYETYAPIEVVNWTNEEGSRFAPATVASGVFAKVLEKDWAHARQDRDGTSFGAALDAIGYRGQERCGEHPLSAFFELHIEQGPILEAEGRDIGVVTGIQAVCWYEVTLTGQDAHTGATPMHLRKNALLGAARLIERIDAIAKAHAPGVGTVGLIENKPNSRNVVPGEVFFCVDLRHPNGGVLDAMEKSFYAAVPEVCEPLGLGVAMQRIWDQPELRFHADCIEAVRRAAELTGYSARDIVSGAGHDAAYVSRVAPAAMIFVPCRGGISHNEAEFSSKEQCAKGAQVLFAAACHASWNASIKRTLDPLATTVLIAIGAGLVALPAIPYLGWPALASWPWLIASIVIHLFYFAGLIESYRVGDLGQVYPIARGAAPLMTATLTTIFVGERLGVFGWGGILMLAAGVLLLSLRGGRDLAKLDRVAVGFALFTAVTVAAYSVVDGIGARLAGPGRATSYTTVLFVGIAPVVVAYALVRRGTAVLPQMVPFWKIGLGGGALAVISYGIANWAMTVAPIAIVAALRETSVLFGALIAVVILKEPLRPARIVAALMIVCGLMLLRVA